jgi:hypothetical protein
MRFPFLSVDDDQGLHPDRPVVPLRLQGAKRFSSALCLLDSGDLNNYMDWDLAEDAGIDLSKAAPIREDSTSERRLAQVKCIIDGGRDRALTLRSVSMIFVRPWNIPGFSSRLGTLGMEQILVRISTAERWTDITETGYDGHSNMRFEFVEVRDGNGRPLSRPMLPAQLAVEAPWRVILDTGSPDSFIARDLALEAEIDLADAQPTGPFLLGDKEVAGLKKSVACKIQHHTGAVINLPEIPVIFTNPWISHDYGGVLGTSALDSLLVTISASGKWIEFSHY